MAPRWVRLLLVMAALLLAGGGARGAAAQSLDDAMGGEPPSQMGTVTGTVSYRERIALVPGTLVTVALQDVSRADARAIVLAEQKIITSGEQVPIPFELRYDPAAIVPSGRYAVRAQIEHDGQLLFTTTRAHFVLTHGYPPQVDLVLERVGQPTRGPAGPAAPSAEPELTQSTWQWQQTTRGNGTVIAASESGKYTVTFLPDGRLAIRADCNRAVGTYTRQDSSLTLQLGQSTLAACPPGSQAREFLEDLATAGAYAFEGENLVLSLRQAGGTMRLVPERPSPLTGTIWQLQGYNNGKSAMVSVLAETEVTATFGTDGSIGGNGGCNTYLGRYSVDGQTLSISSLATTRRACPPEITEQQRAYLAAIQAATQYEIAGEMLMLRDSTGARQAVFVVATGGPTAGQSTTPADDAVTASRTQSPDGSIPTSRIE